MVPKLSYATYYDGCNFTALTEVPYASFRYSYTHSREILKRLLHFRPLLFPLPLTFPLSSGVKRVYYVKVRVALLLPATFTLQAISQV